MKRILILTTVVSVITMMIIPVAGAEALPADDSDSTEAFADFNPQAMVAAAVAGMPVLLSGPILPKTQDPVDESPEFGQQMSWSRLKAMYR